MLGGIVSTVFLLVAVLVMFRIKSEEFDKLGYICCSLGIILLWVVPWGVFTILPIFLIISFASPAGREEWTTHKKRRSAILLATLLLLNISALYPVSQPSGPEQWGNPIATENVNAGFWPASEQYTWLHEGAAVSLLNIRTPHTMSAWSQDTSTITLGVIIGMHNERMRQSIEVMNSNIPGVSIDPNSFSLVEIKTEGSHNYNGEEYFVARFDVKRDGFDPTIAKVLIVGFPEFGGELSVLSITRPNSFTETDVFEEKIVLQYIDFRH